MEHLLQEVTPFINQYGLWVVFIGMMTEGTTMIIVTGILCYLGMLSFKEAVPVAIAGAVAGDQLWYFAGKYYAASLIEKFPSLKKRMEKIKPSIHTKGQWFAFSGRFIYSGAILFPMTLGTYRYPHNKFTLYDTLGVTLWSIGGISLGYLLGTGAEQYFGKMEKLWHLLLLLAMVSLFIWLTKRYMKTKKES